jgi:hypothetical protein
MRGNPSLNAVLEQDYNALCFIRFRPAMHSLVAAAAPVLDLGDVIRIVRASIPENVGQADKPSVPGPRLERIMGTIGTK